MAQLLVRNLADEAKVRSRYTPRPAMPGGRFETTEWSLVLAAGERGSAAAEPEALLL